MVAPPASCDDGPLRQIAGATVAAIRQPGWRTIDLQEVEMRIAVTGGTGKAGRWVVKDLREHGHDVLNVDNRHDGADHGLTLLAALADYGQAVEALSGVEAVVHLAAIPAPDIRSPAETFRI